MGLLRAHPCADSGRLSLIDETRSVEDDKITAHVVCFCEPRSLPAMKIHALRRPWIGSENAGWPKQA